MNPAVFVPCNGSWFCDVVLDPYTKILRSAIVYLLFPISSVAFTPFQV